MILKAKHNCIIYLIFRYISHISIKNNFNSIYINGEFKDNGNAVLVVANHISWWDGFWVEYLNYKVIHRRFYFMMLEEQLIKHWYFRYTGGFSIKKNSRSIFDTLNYTIKLLKNKKNMVLIFPQGQIHSMHTDNIIFKKGIEKIIKEVDPETQVIYVVNLIDYFSNRKPNLYINFKVFVAEELKKYNLEEEYNNFYKEIINNHKTKTS